MIGPVLKLSHYIVFQPHSHKSVMVLCPTYKKDLCIYVNSVQCCPYHMGLVKSRRFFPRCKANFNIGKGGGISIQCCFHTLCMLKPSLTSILAVEIAECLDHNLFLFSRLRHSILPTGSYQQSSSILSGEHFFCLTSGGQYMIQKGHQYVEVVVMMHIDSSNCVSILFVYGLLSHPEAQYSVAE